MQTLLLVEQAYSANARVIQTIDDLIQTLIGL
jgi:flagellar hook-associated protein 1 FlgK